MDADSFTLEPPRTFEGGRGMGGHHVGTLEKETWLTPPEILKALGSFDLDPCASIDRPWPTAAAHYTICDNGLKKPWFGRVWMNPPYGPTIGKWIKRLADHGNGVMFIFARVETSAWFEHIWPRAHAVLFLKGRIHFYHNNGRRSAFPAGAPSALIAYGAQNAKRLSTSGLVGKLIELNP